MFRAADSDNDGYITTEDFYNIVTKKDYKWFVNESIKQKIFINFLLFKNLL
jgi:Ca2+-binding EF-hand superfamily protein